MTTATRFPTLLAAMILLPAPLQAAPQAPAVLLDEAIAKVKAMAYRRDAVDWPTLEAAVRAEATGARDLVDLLPALHRLTAGLGDGHSFVNASADDRAEYKRRHGREFDAGRVAKKPGSPFTARRDARVADLALGRRSAAVATVPMMIGGGPRATAFAQTLADGLLAQSTKACGFVVDLRGNQGGNIWPMVVGLSPLIGDNWASRERKADGTVSSYASVGGGKATIIDPNDENAGATIVAVERWRPLPRLARAPVAVLIDDATASSGEGVAVAFQGRPSTRFFGQTSYGVASSNEGFMLDDRVNIVVTTAMMTDRRGRTHPKGIVPDQRTAPPVTAGSAVDPTLAAARAWLGRQASCRG